MKSINFGTRGEKPEYIGIAYGSFAETVLCAKDSAQVLGVTSKGIFLHNEKGQVVFVSGERFCGPLTINLSETVDFKRIFTLGETCQLGDRVLEFTHCVVTLSEGAHIWQPKKIQFPVGDLVEIKKRVIQLSQNLLEAYQNDLFLPFLSAIAALDAMSPDQIIGLMNLLPSLQAGSGPEIDDRIAGLIGHGPGLTPSGDDFICGFALAEHHLGWCDHSDRVRRGLIETLVERSKTHTTSLAAQLISCAASGAADERLMNCLAWLAQGGGSACVIKKELLSYGSSSGVDTFAGMLAALVLDWSG